MSKDGDPQIALPLQQITTWLQILVDSPEKSVELVAKAWRAQAGHLVESSLHLSYVMGPLSACNLS